jgi:hypothetical protein
MPVAPNPDPPKEGASVMMAVGSGNNAWLLSPPGGVKYGSNELPDPIEQVIVKRAMTNPLIKGTYRRSKDRLLESRLELVNL